MVCEIPGWEPETIPELFARTCREHGESEAVVDGERRWTYAELAADVWRIASALLELGVEPGDRVGLWLPNGEDWIACNLAILQVRAICVPMNSRLRPREADHVLKGSAPRVLITTESFLSNSYLDMLEQLIEPGERYGRAIRSSQYPALRQVIAVEGSRPWTHDLETLLEGQPRTLGAQLEELAAAASVEDPANVFWTSGSTGAPKGAVVSHEALGNVASYSRILDCDGRDRFLIPCPLFYTAGYYWGMLAAILNGACMVPGRTFAPEETLELIERERATTLIGVASAHLRLLDCPDLERRSTESLRVAYSGGAQLPAATLWRLKEALGLDLLFNLYGMTETAGITTITRPDDGVEEAAASIGFAMPGFELRYVDPDSGADVEPGSAGELWVRGPYVLKTYYAATPEEIESSFAPGGWFRTGDLIRRDETGRHFFAGRIKDIVKVGGENVAAQEVEGVLREHEAVRDVSVLAVPDAERTEVVAAALVAREPLDPAELSDYCRPRLAAFKVPRHFVQLPELPQTVTGKVARVELREIVMAAIATAQGGRETDTKTEDRRSNEQG